MPCLVGDTLPNSVERSDIVLSRSASLNIKDLQIVIGSKFELELKGVVEKMKESLCREDRSSKVVIKKRLIRLGFHNGLTMVTDIIKDLEFQKEGKKEGTRLRIVEDRRDET